MAAPGIGIAAVTDALKVPLLRNKPRTPPANQVRRNELDEKVKKANLVRFNTLPEFLSLSEEITRQAPSQFGWFDQKQAIGDFRQKIAILAEDKQIEMQLQQVEMIDEIDKQSKAPVSAKEKFIKTVQKVMNVNAFFSEIQRSIQEKELTPSYPRRSSFNGVSQYRKNPHMSKMAEIIQSTKRKTWRHRVWNTIKLFRGVLSLPIKKVESLVESRFGSAAVSYFVLLQRLILLNFIIAIYSIFIWFPRWIPCPEVARNSSNNITYSESTCNKPVYNGEVVYPDSSSFLTLNGLDNTSLFLGSYRENPFWDYKSAYFYTFFTSTFTILIFISYLLGQAYIDTFSILNSSRNLSLYMANIVFGGWTYTLANAFSVSSEHKRFLNVLRETVWECSPNYQSQRLFLFRIVDRFLPTDRDGLKNFMYVCCLWLWRAILWAITLALLTMGALLIVITALQRVCRKDSLFSFVYGFIPSLWHTFLELVFGILTAAELYNTQTKGMISQLIKHLLMRFISLSSIYTVVAYLYFLSKCEVDASVKFPLCFFGSNSEPVSCLASGCWETEVAKLFHEYLVAQFISSILIRSIMITLQNFIRIGVFQIIKRCSCCKRIPGLVKDLIKSFFSTPFHLPKHVIKVIYIQSLVWSGMLFCPYQHLIGFVGFLLLYISMFLFSMWNCRISSKQPRTARSNLVYYMILFATFFWVMIVAHFPLFQFVPSINCGPFSGTQYYYEFYRTIHLSWISDSLSLRLIRNNCTNSTSLACSDRLTLIDVNFWDSPAVGPLTVLSVGILLIYFATIKKKNYEIIQLRKQILLLAIDRMFYVEGNAHFLSALSQKYLKDKKAQVAYVSAIAKKDSPDK